MTVLADPGTVPTAVPDPAGTPAPPRIRRSRPPAVVTVAGAVLVLLVLAAAFPGLFTGASPTATDPLGALTGPGAAHWLGTDELGRDEFARVLYGARPSLLIGLCATVLAVTAGTAVGLAAGLSGRVGDSLLMRAVDVLLSLPQLMLALLVVTVLGTGTVDTAVAVAVGLAPGYARIVRAETRVVRGSGHVESAVGLGLRRGTIVARHILPNVLGPLLVVATVGFGAAVIAASGLSFLGLGAQPPSPEWGAMLADGRGYLAAGWWLGVFPGAAVTLSVVAVNIVGRHLQARFTRRTP